MKKRFFTFGVLFLLTLQSQAGSDTLFRYDRNRIEQALIHVTQVESIVTKDPSLSWNDLNDEGNPFIALIEPVTSPFENAGEPPLGIPSFLWGCALGLPGMLVTALVTHDQAEVRKAFFGCLAWNTVAIVVATIYIINEANRPHPGLKGCIDAWFTW